MDATAIATLASAAVSLLAPYVKQAGERLAKKVGEEIGKGAEEVAWDKAKKLYESVKAKFSTKFSATEALDDLARSPDDGDVKASVRIQLKKIMSVDEDFSKELANILKEAASAGADNVFHTNIYGDVQKLVQMGNVYGDVTI